MNNKSSLIVSIVAVVLAIVALVFSLTNKKTQEPVKQISTENISIAYINVDTLLNNYDLYNSLMINFMTKQQNYERELQSKSLSLQQRSMKLQNDYNKGLITTATYQQKMQQLQQENQSLAQWYDEKKQELANDQVMILNRLQDSLNNAIAEFNKDNKYQIILRGDAILYGDKGMNITDTITALLNSKIQ